MELWREKVELCRERKIEMEIEKYKRKVFLVHKWEILREKRKEFEEAHRIKNEQETRCYAWITYVNLMQMLRFTFENFNELRWQIRLEQRRNKCARKI